MPSPGSFGGQGRWILLPFHLWTITYVGGWGVLNTDVAQILRCVFAVCQTPSHVHTKCMQSESAYCQGPKMRVTIDLTDTCSSYRRNLRDFRFWHWLAMNAVKCYQISLLQLIFHCLSLQCESALSGTKFVVGLSSLANRCNVRRPARLIYRCDHLHPCFYSQATMGVYRYVVMTGCHCTAPFGS